MTDRDISRSDPAMVHPKLGIFLNPEQEKFLKEVNDAAQNLYFLLEVYEEINGRSRELAVAKTHIEEAYLWVLNHLNRI